jgi:hypothetical protein
MKIPQLVIPLLQEVRFEPPEKPDSNNHGVAPLGLPKPEKLRHDFPNILNIPKDTPKEIIRFGEIRRETLEGSDNDPSNSPGHEELTDDSPDDFGFFPGSSFDPGI